MPETARGIWYPESGAPADVPTDMEKLADGVDELLGEVGLDQLVATEEDDGKLVIVKDGAAAYKAMSGDVTISSTGAATIGTGKVVAAKLGSSAVETAKINNGAVTLGKLAEALGLTEGYFADSAVGEAKVKDGAVTSRKAKLTAGVLVATEKLALSTSYQDVPGAVLEITPAVASILKVTAVFDFNMDLGWGIGIGSIKVDSESEQSRVARLQFGSSTDPEAGRGTASQVYALSLTAAPHTIKMRAKREGTSTGVNAETNTSFLYELIAV